MFKNLELFRMSHAMAAHAGARQGVIAGNMANADTPGYRARDVVPFASFYEGGDGGMTARATRAGHMHGATDPKKPGLYTTQSGDAAPNGNSVSLEAEMLKAVEVQRQHERAITIYRSGMTVLRAAIGRR